MQIHIHLRFLSEITFNKVQKSSDLYSEVKFIQLVDVILNIFCEKCVWSQNDAI